MPYDFSAAPVGLLTGSVPPTDCLRGDGRPFVVAHRGASGHAPENTLSAYRHAVMHGATHAECDVQVTADGEVVLMHDRSLSRTTTGRGLVSRRTLAQLRSLDAGAWKGEGFAGERVPRLDEVLDFGRSRFRLFIELKAGRGLSERVVDVLQRQATRKHEAVVMSFDPGLIAGVERRAPAYNRVLLRRAPLFRGTYGRSVVDQALRAKAQALGLNNKGVGPEVCEYARKVGLALLVFTVNDPWRAQTLANWGVNGIISDLPRLIRKALDRAARSASAA